MFSTTRNLGFALSAAALFAVLAPSSHAQEANPTAIAPARNPQP